MVSGVGGFGLGGLGAVIAGIGDWDLRGGGIGLMG